MKTEPRPPVRLDPYLVAALYTSKGRFKEGTLKNLIDLQRKAAIEAAKKQAQ
jgi:hypothetical protein